VATTLPTNAATPQDVFRINLDDFAHDAPARDRCPGDTGKYDLSLAR
jgi:hypothetical protein